MENVIRNVELNLTSSDLYRVARSDVQAATSSFVATVESALSRSGVLTGYHWGITRKKAMLGWEAGQVGLH